MNPSNISQLHRRNQGSTPQLSVIDDISSNDSCSLCNDPADLAINKPIGPTHSLFIKNSSSTPANMNLFSKEQAPQPEVSEIRPPGSRGLNALENVDGACNASLNVCTSNAAHLADGHSVNSLQPFPSHAYPGFQHQTPARCVSFASDIPSAITTAASTFPRPRSGSWSGVNESDDDLEQLNECIAQPRRTSDASRSYGSVIEQPNANGTTGSSHHQYHQTRELRAQKMKRRLKFFFMNPVEKWHAKHRFPWKLLLQIVKIVVVTLQLWLFAEQRYSHVAYLWDTRVSFSHMFLLGWESSREINVYPPSDGPLAVYTKEEFYNYMDYAITSYANLSAMAIGSYEYHHFNGSDIVLPSDLCCYHYTSDLINKSEECLKVPYELVNNGTRDDWSTLDFLKEENFTLQFETLTSCTYIFKVVAVKLRSPPDISVPDCYNLTTALVFDNDDRDGQMLVGLNIQATVLSCNNSEPEWGSAESTSINVITILVCSLSLVMCMRSLYRGQVLRYTSSRFFRVHYQHELSMGDKLEFCNLWYVLICINDVLIIIGTLLKLGLESRIIGDTTVQVLRINHSEFVKGTQLNYEGYLDTWNVCSLFLGVGNLLVWFGCLRYLGFFQTYNVLILTLKKCLPNVLRYSICILMLFAGYCFCGWLILSPYHIKFRSLSTTMECLFSLINGDDMFATFSSTSAKDPLIWWFSRIYLYSFISLFIYVILSLFLAIIMDAYDTIKKYYADGFPLSPLNRFVGECQEDATSRVFHEEGDQTIHDFVNSVCCWCCLPASTTRGRETQEESQPLLQ